MRNVMDIGRVNNLLDQVRVKLESLDPASLEESMGEIQNQLDGDSAPDDGSVGTAKKRLGHLLAKLGANRSDSNKVKAYGSK
jgi:hypothetical protein